MVEAQSKSKWLKSRWNPNSWGGEPLLVAMLVTTAHTQAHVMICAHDMYRGVGSPGTTRWQLHKHTHTYIYIYTYPNIDAYYSKYIYNIYIYITYRRILIHTFHTFIIYMLLTLLTFSIRRKESPSQWTSMGVQGQLAPVMRARTFWQGSVDGAMEAGWCYGWLAPAKCGTVATRARFLSWLLNSQ